ncbi:T9SS type A sorting domain-containing protein [Chryseobacterium sp.]|uniref:T9SS type A sorting domain-containing protein n=1 Tax=Chryseobacterium sp. TaxID=1871047 RepID=UPI002618ADCC|nr:T9SS type A sorting domain-containing protein [Chryseobacterium sp.]
MKKLFILSLFIITSIKSQTLGTQDMTFGNSGSTEFTFSPPVKGFQAYNMNLLPNNDFLVGGVSNWGCSSTSNYTGILSKFNQEGTLDTSYNQNGVLDNSAIVNRMKPSRDGNYFILNQYSTLSKVDVNGNLITSWGVNGYITLPYPYNIRDWKESLNNEIIINAVKVNFDNKVYSAIFKYHQNGTSDVSFGTSGKIEFANQPNLIIAKTDIDNEGNYLFTGKISTSLVYNDANIIVFKTNPNGNPISNFGTNGLLTITNYVSNTTNDTFTFVTPDNGIIIITDRLLMFKVLSNATLDPSFSNGYKFPQNVAGITDVHFVNNNFYVFADRNATTFLLGKININGNIDTTYNGNGYILINKLAGPHGSTKTLIQGNRLIIAENMENYYCSQLNWKLIMRRFYIGEVLSTIENKYPDYTIIYPNPAEDKVFVKGLTNIELLSIDGRKIEIKTQFKDKEQILDISQLNKGIYFIKGKRHDDKVVSKKIIKK